MTENKADWEAYWQGRRTDTTGALTGVEHDQALQTFWRQSLSPLGRDAKFVDLACGAGTVLKTAHSLGFTQLTGIDVSKSALDTLKMMLSEVAICESSVHATPFPDHQFDVVTSQFGLEYAGAEQACQEAARLLSPGGTFLAVMHMTDGAIHHEVRGRLEVARQIQDARFIAASQDFFRAVYAGDKPGLETAAEVLAPARDLVTALIVPGEQSFASHLIQGAAQLWQRRANYRLDDVVGWFASMDEEINAFAGRMQSMLDASQTATQMQALAAIFADRGIAMAPLEKLDLGGTPAAWLLRTAAK